MEHSRLEDHYANEIIPVPDYRSGHDCCRLFVLQRAGVGDESGKLSRRSTYFFRHERFIPIRSVSWRNAVQCRNSSKSWRQNLGQNYDMGDPSYECSRSLHPEDDPWQSTTTLHVAARAILRPPLPEDKPAHAGICVLTIKNPPEWAVKLPADGAVTVWFTTPQICEARSYWPSDTPANPASRARSRFA